MQSSFLARENELNALQKAAKKMPAKNRGFLIEWLVELAPDNGTAILPAVVRKKLIQFVLTDRMRNKIYAEMEMIRVLQPNASQSDAVRSLIARGAEALEAIEPANLEGRHRLLADRAYRMLIHREQFKLGPDATIEEAVEVLSKKL